MNPREPSERWWTPFAIGPGQTVVLHLGPLTLRLRRHDGEWWLSWEQQENDEDSNRAERILSSQPLPVDRYDRFVCGDGEGAAALKPVLADRAIIVKPRQPVYVLPGEETTFYISTPVWIRVEVGEPPRILKDVPVMRLSDTWFGPSTREGELCYAVRTHARSSLHQVSRRPHRAVTPLHIRNRAGTPLPIDEVSLPVPLLSLYGGGDGNLWTEVVSLTRATDSDMASLGVAAGPPPDVAGARLLSGPRTQPEKVGLVRAFSGLFG
jgi:hypothetical protein